MFIVIRLRNDNNANIDSYQFAKKYPQFTILPYSGKKLVLSFYNLIMPQKDDLPCDKCSLVMFRFLFIFWKWEIIWKLVSRKLAGR